MKKITLILTFLLTILALPSVIFATEENVAKIGDTEYYTLQDAIDAVQDNTQTTITLINNVEDGTGIVTKSGQNIIIDFNKKTYDASNPLVGSDGTKTNGFQLRKGSTVTLKNGRLISNGTVEKEAAKILIQNYSNLTIHDMIIDATDVITEYALSNNNGKVNITGNTSITVADGNYAFDMCWAPNKGYPEGTQITVNTVGKIEGNIELGTWGDITTADEINIKSTLKINKIQDFAGNIVINEDYLISKLTVPSGYELRKIAESKTEYSLVKLNSITIANTENGRVIVDKTKAAAEDTVNLTIEPNSGYVAGSIKVVILGTTDELVVENNRFIMPDEPVTVTVMFDELIKKVEAPTINKKEEFKEVTLGVSNVVDTNKILLESLLKDKNFTNIQDRNVKVDIGITKKELSEDLKSKMMLCLSSISKNIKLFSGFDISISVNDLNNSHLGYLTNLSAPMEFTIGLPKELQRAPDGFIRKFYMVYEHNGEVKTIDDVNLSTDGKFATFFAYEFSTYALAYEDVKDANYIADSDVPKTGDNITMNTLIATLSVVGIVILKKVNAIKRKH